jgi:hypothetical protein
MGAVKISLRFVIKKEKIESGLKGAEPESGYREDAVWSSVADP